MACKLPVASVPPAVPRRIRPGEIDGEARPHGGPGLRDLPFLVLPDDLEATILSQPRRIPERSCGTTLPHGCCGEAGPATPR